MVDHVYVTFYYDIYPETRKTLTDLNVRLHYLATWWDVLNVVMNGRYLPPAQVTQVEQFLHDPAKWSASHGGVANVSSG